MCCTIMVKAQMRSERKPITNLETWLTSKQTDPDLQHMIVSHLHSWRDKQPQHTSTFFVFDDRLNSQSNIGWKRFFEGWFSKDWLVLQQAYYNTIKSRCSGKQWVVALITLKCGTSPGTYGNWGHRNGVLHNSQNIVTEREE